MVFPFVATSHRSAAPARRRRTSQGRRPQTWPDSLRGQRLGPGRRRPP